MAFRICGKTAKEVFTSDTDRKDVPLCAEHKKATIALQESLGHECEFSPIARNAQPIDTMCQFKLDRMSAEDHKEFKKKNGVTDSFEEKRSQL